MYLVIVRSDRLTHFGIILLPIPLVFIVGYLPQHRLGEILPMCVIAFPSAQAVESGMGKFLE